MKRRIVLTFLLLLVIPIVSAAYVDDFLAYLQSGDLGFVTGKFHLVTGQTHRPAHVSGCSASIQCDHKQDCVGGSCQTTVCNAGLGVFSGDCKKGYRCFYEPNNNRCRAAQTFDATAGQSCDNNLDCGQDQRCLNNMCVIGGGFSLGGGRCNPAYNDCPQGKYCNDLGSCIDAPTGVANNAPCTENNDCGAQQTCRYGKFGEANANDRRCRNTLPHSGVTASVDVECNPAIDNCPATKYCNYLGKCVDRKPCTSTPQCDLSETCINSRCSTASGPANTPVTAVQTCTSQSQCGSGKYCAFNTPASGTCQNLPCSATLNNCFGGGNCVNGVCQASTQPETAVPTTDPVQQKMNKLDQALDWLEPRVDDLQDAHTSTSGGLGSLSFTGRFVAFLTGKISLSQTLIQQQGQSSVSQSTSLQNVNPSLSQAIQATPQSLLSQPQQQTLTTYVTQIQALDARIRALKSSLCPTQTQHHDISCGTTGEENPVLDTASETSGSPEGTQASQDSGVLKGAFRF